MCEVYDGRAGRVTYPFKGAKYLKIRKLDLGFINFSLKTAIWRCFVPAFDLVCLKLCKENAWEDIIFRIFSKNGLSSNFDVEL